MRVLKSPECVVCLYKSLKKGWWRLEKSVGYFPTVRRLKMNEPLDKFHYHELLDRLHIVNTMVDEFLLSHPVCDQELSIKEKLMMVSIELGNAYQEIGTKSFEL